MEIDLSNNKIKDEEYLKIVKLAADTNEEKVDNALTWLLDQNMPIEYKSVSDLIKKTDELPSVRQINIPSPDVQSYDALLRAVA